MKPYSLLIVLLLGALGTAVAQQRTRDVLFPSFQQDRANLQKKDNTTSPTKDARTTREQLFTNYHRPTGISQGKAGSLKANRAAITGKNPSDMSAVEAEKVTRSKRGNQLTPATAIPSQGNETENAASQIKSAAPAITPATPLAPAAAPVKRSSQLKKQ